MTLYGAIKQLAQMRDSECMPTMFKPLFDKVIETVSECEEPGTPTAPQRMRGYERVVYCGECAHMMPDGRCREFADDNIRPSASDYCSAGEKRADMKGGEQDE